MYINIYIPVKHVMQDRRYLARGLRSRTPGQDKRNTR